MCLKKPDLKNLKAIIPAAGKGTRFYPFSKFIPKELLPVANRLAIDFVLDEINDAKIDKICAVYSQSKKLLLEYLQQTRSGLDFAEQAAPKGLGDAIFVSKSFFNQSSIIPVLLPDNIFCGTNNVTRQLIESFIDSKCCAIIAIGQVKPEEAHRYGIIGIDKRISSNLIKIKSIIEKPKSGSEPSNLAVFGRYVFSSCIFQALDDLDTGFNGEVQLTDGINKLIDAGKAVYALEIQDKFFDVGNPKGWLEANEILLKDRNGKSDQCLTV